MNLKTRSEKIDKLARHAKRTSELYERHKIAAKSLGVTAHSKQAFWNMSENRTELVANLEDAAAKWPEYRNNMAQLGMPYYSPHEFLSLSAKERARNYSLSRGTGRSATQFLSGSYSSRRGWAVYRDSLEKMKLPLEYTEYEFINQEINTIDQLARHAKACERLHTNFEELSTLAGKPPICTAIELYQSKDLSKWQQKYEQLQTEWASRILYSDSCRRVGAKPNWAVFELKTPDKQIEAAVLADSIANNFDEYNALCATLGYAPNANFLNASVVSQREQVTVLQDELWRQRKQTIKTGVAIVAVIAAAIIAKKAYDELQPSPPPSSQQIGSQIDRDAFAHQRRDFWKAEAQNNPGRYSDTAANLERMKLGKAPIGNDGFPMELHHPGGDPNATFIPMTRTDHRLGDNYMKNHPWLFEK